MPELGRPAPTNASTSSIGAEVGMHGGVATLGRADRPRAPDVVGPGEQRVVPALPVGDADRVDRWQVDDVEPGVRDLLESAPRARALRRDHPRTGGRTRTTRPATAISRSIRRRCTRTTSRARPGRPRREQFGDRVVEPGAEPDGVGARRAAQRRDRLGESRPRRLPAPTAPAPRSVGPRPRTQDRGRRRPRPAATGRVARWRTGRATPATSNS